MSMDGSAAMPGAVIKTTCPYCGTGCGVDVRVTGSTVQVQGDASHPTNAGKLCVKGSALGDTVGPQGRLLHPSVNGVRSSWDAALDHVAATFTQVIRDHGPDAVAFYVSGQILTEDYYAANKLAKGFIGTANIDTNSRLCMSSAVAGHKRAFGEDIVPVSYADLESADLVVLVGSNTAWCHPILFQRIVREKERRPQMKLVVIDPRRTATTEMADLHLPLRPGTDVWLFNGLLSFLHQHGIVDSAFVEAHTTGLATAMAIADNTAGDVRSVAQQCKLQEAALAEFYRLWARTERVVTAFSMGVNQSSAGTDKVNAIINCHLLSGRIGKPGAGPFSITGQPNAMGGREVGGLSNMLAAHMDLENAAHRELVQDFWASPVIASRPGLKAVDLFEKIEAGEVKAVWIMATNPVVSLPNADQVKRALEACELVVVSDCMARTDTTAFAHVLLPAHGWGEKDGTVTNSERCISRLRPFLPPIGEAKADWWAVAQVATRMGFGEAFAWSGVHEVFDEHCRLTGYRNDAATPRYLDLSGLAGRDRAAFDALPPTRWPVTVASPETRHSRESGNPASPASDVRATRTDWIRGADTVPPTSLRSETVARAPSARMTESGPEVFSDGRFYTPDRKARFVAVKPRMPAHAVEDAYPMVLNTGRVRDHWHTMTRTGLSPRLSQHIPEPFVDLHPGDALLCGVREHELARITSRWGSCVARVRFSGEMARKQVFVPIHWNGQFASDGRVGKLVNPAVDPVSGEPEFKHTPVRVEPFRVAWHGFVLLRDHHDTGPSRVARLTSPSVWWTRVTGQDFTRYELAGRRVENGWSAMARQMLGATHVEADWLEYEDPSAGQYRGALIVDERIEACVFVSPRPDLPSRAWLSGLFAKDALEDVDRMGLLVGEPHQRGADTGVTVCSCFGVGRKTIEQAIRGGCHSPKALGETLRCGTNCGSCVPELKSLITQTLAPA
jgi:assimilatory nitrate reductase catalytic subunit